MIRSTENADKCRQLTCMRGAARCRRRLELAPTEAPAANLFFSKRTNFISILISIGPNWMSHWRNERNEMKSDANCSRRWRAKNSEANCACTGKNKQIQQSRRSPFFGRHCMNLQGNLKSGSRRKKTHKHTHEHETSHCDLSFDRNGCSVWWSSILWAKYRQVFISLFSCVKSIPPPLSRPIRTQSMPFIGHWTHRGDAIL